MVDRTITLVRDDGTEIVADIFFTYHSDEFNKDYVVFQVRDTNEISAASYVSNDDKNGQLDKIETDEEWEMLEELLNEYADETKRVESAGCQGCSGNCHSCSECEGCEDCEE
ncbi:MAG: DUF1292 domain-containing protein [Acholeplasmatales bacterium]|nr:DUF1292 domain-containing protein [Acholeplasmatales bacterium]